MVSVNHCKKVSFTRNIPLEAKVLSNNNQSDRPVSSTVNLQVNPPKNDVLSWLS